MKDFKLRFYENLKERKCGVDRKFWNGMDKIPVGTTVQNAF